MNSKTARVIEMHRLATKTVTLEFQYGQCRVTETNHGFPGGSRTIKCQDLIHAGEWIRALIAPVGK